MKTPETTTSTPRRYPSNTGKQLPTQVSVDILGQNYSMYLKWGREEVSGEVREVGMRVTGRSVNYLSYAMKLAIRSMAMQLHTDGAFGAKA